MPSHSAPWLAMVGFGAFHGLNPGMGWLFALALGLQQRRARAIWVSLAPIALGHASSLVLVAALVLALGTLVSMAALEIAAAVVLVSFGAYKLRTYYRHPRWVGMRVGLRDLYVWSFLMATAHGAGLMVAPILVDVVGASGSPASLRAASGDLGLAVALHTGAMLVVMALIAWVVYRKLGLAVLRRSWINFDFLWAIALLVVGGLALGRSVWAVGGERWGRERVSQWVSESGTALPLSFRGSEGDRGIARPTHLERFLASARNDNLLRSE